jgi:hypothetical protein
MVGSPFFCVDFLDLRIEPIISGDCKENVKGSARSGEDR